MEPYISLPLSQKLATCPQSSCFHGTWTQFYIFKIYFHFIIPSTCRSYKWLISLCVSCLHHSLIYIGVSNFRKFLQFFFIGILTLAQLLTDKRLAKIGSLESDLPYHWPTVTQSALIQAGERTEQKIHRQVCVDASDKHNTSIFRVKESYSWNENEDNMPPPSKVCNGSSVVTLLRPWRL